MRGSSPDDPKSAFSLGRSTASRVTFTPSVAPNSLEGNGEKLTFR